MVVENCCRWCGKRCKTTYCCDRCRKRGEIYQKVEAVQSNRMYWSLMAVLFVVIIIGIYANSAWLALSLLIVLGGVVPVIFPFCMEETIVVFGIEKSILLARMLGLTMVAGGLVMLSLIGLRA